MANVITLNTPTKADYLSHFVDKFLADRAAGQQEDQVAADRASQDAFRQKQLDQTSAYQQGQLTNQQNTFKAGQEDKEIESFVKTAIEPYMSSGRPEDMAKAQANVQQVLTEHPDWKGRLIGYALRAGGGQLPADQTNANVGQFSVNQTGIAAGGGTDPNAVNFATHKALGTFMPKEGFTQQQAADLATRQPAKPSGPTALTNTVPKPTGAPVADFEARSIGAMPTAPENLTSQTAITTTGMQQAGETKRKGMEIAAKNAPLTPGSTLTGDAFLNTLPGGVRELVKKIANYDIDPSKVTSLRGDARQKMMEMVTQYDPTYDQTQFGAKASARRSFTSGEAAQAIRAANTAIQHLSAADEAFAQMNNTPIPIVNTVGNFVSKQTGGAAISKFNTEADAVANEMAKVFKGTGATSDTEIKEWRQNLSPNMSPEQFKASKDALMELMSGRLNALSDQYTKAMGKPRDFGIISPRSGELLKKMGRDPGSMGAGPSPVAGGDQQPQSFKQTGMVHLSNGQTVRGGTNDGVNFFDLTTGKPIQ